MNKTETIDTVARSAEISKAVAERVVEAFEARLKAHGDAGARVVIRGFGSFSRGLPSPKAGRNPRTGQPLTYTAYHKPKNIPTVAESTLCREIAADAQIGEATAQRALDALQAAIAVSLRKGGVVGFNGFGTCLSAQRVPPRRLHSFLRARTGLPAHRTHRPAVPPVQPHARCAAGYRA